MAEQSTLVLADDYGMATAVELTVGAAATGVVVAAGTALAPVQNSIR